MEQQQGTVDLSKGTTTELQCQVAMAFGTPISTHSWPDSNELNAQLAQRALDMEQESAGLARSNVSSWHSELDFLDADEPAVRQLLERIKTMTAAMTNAVAMKRDTPETQQYRVEAWANITRSGGYNTVHNHPNSLWSGTYYASCGARTDSPPENGKLELLDPRAGVNMIHLSGTIMEGRYLIDPLPGLMVFFPSWLSHFVHPYFGEDERISISFNVTPGAPSADF